MTVRKSNCLGQRSSVCSGCSNALDIAKGGFMTRFFKYLCLLALTGLLAPGCASQSLAAAHNPEIPGSLSGITSRSAAESIPFELYGSLILIQITINGSGPLRFIMDSGAGVSVINRTRAVDLGLKLKEMGERAILE